MKNILYKILTILASVSLLNNACGVSSSMDSTATSEPTQVEEPSEPMDALDGYEEVDISYDEFANKTIDVEFISELTEEIPDNPEGNNYTDGSLLLYDSITDGTPYSFGGVLYDDELFDERVYVKRDSNSIDSYQIYRLIPKKSGESYIFSLTKYLTDEKYEGTILYVRIDDDLQCHILWYENAKEGENFTFIET